MLKNKNVQMGLIVGVVLAILVGGYFLVASKNQAKKNLIDQTETQDIVHKLTPEELGLSMEANSAGNEVKFIIEKAKDITAIEYQLTYEADSTAQERSEGGESRVERGITGEAEIESGETSFESEWLVLGSESAGVVRYDKGVKSVELTLKITKKDGKLYEATDKLEL